MLAGSGLVELREPVRHADTPHLAFRAMADDASARDATISGVNCYLPDPARRVERDAALSVSRLRGRRGGR
jgi:hypothetical protein